MAYLDTTLKGKFLDGSGIFISHTIPDNLKEHFISFTYYFKSKIVVPTEGCVVITATDNGINYGSVENGAVPANTFDFDRISIYGHIKAIKADFKGIKGADSFKIDIHSYG